MWGIESLGVLLLGFIFNQNAFATSFASESERATRKPQLALELSEPSCIVQAKFLKEQHQLNESSVKVWWNFEIQKRYSPQNICPTKNIFALSIRGAEVSPLDDGQVQYIYPVHIQPPHPDQMVKLQIRLINVKEPFTKKEYQEWLVTNWTSGYQP